MSWTRDQVLEATAGRILQDGEATVFGCVVTDSRGATPNGIFVALRGERFDGHDFLRDAVRRGSHCLVIHKNAPHPRGVTVIRVGDTLRALGDMARYRRQNIDPKVLAITGSNGKTTTKEMVATILERARLGGSRLYGRVLKTEGNYNNLVGLPLTLLRLKAETRVAVVELGTNRPGEIRVLTEIADPDIGLITSVAPAHLAGLGTVAGVAREKGALFRAMRRESIAVVNLDDPRVERLGKTFRGERLTYGSRGEVRSEHGRILPGGAMVFTLRLGRHRLPVRLRLVGKHNLSNALGAAAMAYALGVEPEAVRRGLQAFRPVSRRMEIERWKGVGLINDTYNANPASMEEALKVLADMPVRRHRVAVLGDMLELGPGEIGYHKALGKRAAFYKVDRLYLLGRFAGHVREGALRAGMNPDQMVVGRDHAILGAAIRKQTRPGDWVLFKGSRGAAMDRVLASFKEGEA